MIREDNWHGRTEQESRRACARVTGYCMLRLMTVSHVSACLSCFPVLTWSGRPT